MASSGASSARLLSRPTTPPASSSQAAPLPGHDLEALFQACTLGIITPGKPLLLGDPPREAPGGPLYPEIDVDGAADRAEDAWVQGILGCEQREDAYYDELLPIYFTVTFPPSFPSTATRPALRRLLTRCFSVSLDGAYVASSPSTLSPSAFPPRDKVKKPSPLGQSLATSLMPPVTPLPRPDGEFRAQAHADPSHATAVFSFSFKGQKTPEPEVAVQALDKGKAKAVDEEALCIGRARGLWVAIWKMAGPVSYVRTPLADPLLSVTATVSYRHDPVVAAALYMPQSSGDISAQLVAEKAPAAADEDEEYAFDAFDEVNLLEGLGEDMFLPSARLPTPLLQSTYGLNHEPKARVSLSRRASLMLGTAEGSVTRNRRKSAPSIASLSAVTVAADDPVAAAAVKPSEAAIIRRSFRRLMGVQSPLAVRMRSVPLRAAMDEGLHFDDEDGEGEEREGDDGIMLCVELDNNSAAGAFLIEKVQVQMDPGGGGSAGGTVEVSLVVPRRKSAEDVFPIRLSGVDQHSLLYALAFDADLAVFDEAEAAASALPPPTPISAMAPPSPSLRPAFGGAEEDGPAGLLSPFVSMALEPGARSTLTADRVRGGSGFRRNVAIVVTGRPVRPRGPVPNGLEADGHLVDIGEGASAGSVPDSKDQFPTLPIVSRWNCLVDLKTFALRAQRKRTSWIAAGSQKSLIAAPTASRTATPKADVAGSKRHTVAGLSEVLAQAQAQAQARERASRSSPHQVRNSAPVISAPPSVFSASRRFFSSAGPAPTAGETLERPQSPTSSTSTGGGGGGLRTPERRSAVDGALSEGKRASNPLPGALGQAVKLAPNTMIGGPLGGGGWRPPGSAPLQLGAPAQMSDPPPAAEGSEGLLISVTLVPLRGPGAGSEGADGGPLLGSEAPGPAANGLVAPAGAWTKGHHKGASSRRLGSFTGAGAGDLGGYASRDLDAHAGSMGGAMGTGIGWTRNRVTRVGLLDVFLVEVFVMNRTQRVRRFWVRVPPRAFAAGAGAAERERAGKALEAAGSAWERSATLVPLENDVRMGPLAPGTCQSVRLRFLAVREGVHAVDELRLVDMEDAHETVLRRPLTVVVDA